MIDFVLGLALAGMLVRGWLRGLVREALDLVGLVVGLWLAFRLSAPFGDFLTDSFGVGPEAGRIGGGILLFVLFGALLSVAAHHLSKVMNLPGLSVVNRVGGAAIAVGWGVVIVLIFVSLIEVLPISADWRDDIEESNVVQLIAGEDALPRRLFQTLAGDNVMTAVASLRELFGSSRAAPRGDEVFTIPPAESDEIRQVRSEAERILELLNEDRVSVGSRAVRSVEALTRLAEIHAESLYTNGRLRRMQNCRARLAERSYQVLACDNGVALAGTAVGGYQGVYETSEGQAMIEEPGFDRVGIAVVEGPTGRLVVIVIAS
jgi:membrane protein required for colicin V production